MGQMILLYAGRPLPHTSQRVEHTTPARPCTSRQPLRRKKTQELLTLSSCPCMKATFAICKRQTVLKQGLAPTTAPPSACGSTAAPAPPEGAAAPRRLRARARRDKGRSRAAGAGQPPQPHHAVGVDDGFPVIRLLRQPQRLVQQLLGRPQLALHDAELRRAGRPRAGHGRARGVTARAPRAPAPHLGFLQQEDNAVLAVLLVVPGEEGERCGARVTGDR